MAVKPAIPRKSHLDRINDIINSMTPEEQAAYALESYRRNLDAGSVLATNSYKSLTLLSGAAAVSILAFLGQVISSETSGRMVDVTAMVPSLYLFGAAAFLGGICPSLGYLHVAYRLVGNERSKSKLGFFLLWGQRGGTILGWACFVLGLYWTGEAFETLLKVVPT